MSSSAPATWLPAAIARVAAAPTVTGPRHLAPGADDDLVLGAVREIDAISSGRHAEPEWSRELFDPRRDGDPFAWLGFDADRD